MYNIGIIGNGPERISDPGKFRRTINNVLDLLIFQYGKDELVFNIKGETGVSLWAGQECVEKGFKYHLFLPYSLEKTYAHWYEEQKKLLQNQYKHAYSLTICNYSYDVAFSRLVKNSNFIVCFWIGNKQGEVFEAINYALENNKIVLNGLDELKLITDKNLEIF